ncbi:MAG TPA: porin family protein [Lentimicrobium sp.]|jgi:hypothetical protein|nr:porin family protein [Lentimicrobium sp.]
MKRHKHSITMSVALFLIFFSTAAMAQAIPGLTFGPKAGAAFSTFRSSQEQIENEIRNSLHFGVFARLGNKVYLQPELNFMNRVGELSYSGPEGGSKSIHIKTIDVPVLLGARILEAGIMNVRIFTGPSASIAVNKEVTAANWSGAVNEDDIRTANWAIQAGAGIDFLVFTLDLRYEAGMSNFSQKDEISLKNNMFLISLGWKIL